MLSQGTSRPNDNPWQEIGHMSGAVSATTGVTVLCASRRILSDPTAIRHRVFRFLIFQLFVAIYCLLLKQFKSSDSTSVSANSGRLRQHKHISGQLYTVVRSATGNSRAQGRSNSHQPFHGPVLNRPFLSSVAIRSFLPAYNHVVPIPSHRFPSCWVVEQFSAFL